MSWALQWTSYWGQWLRTNTNWTFSESPGNVCSPLCYGTFQKCCPKTWGTLGSALVKQVATLWKLGTRPWFWRVQREVPLALRLLCRPLWHLQRIDRTGNSPESWSRWISVGLNREWWFSSRPLAIRSVGNALLALHQWLCNVKGLEVGAGLRCTSLWNRFTPKCWGQSHRQGVRSVALWRHLLG